MATKIKDEESTEKKHTEYSRPVLVSAYFYGEKPISVIGIENSDSEITHVFDSSDLSKSDWLDFMRDLNKQNILISVKQSIVDQIVSGNKQIAMPRMKADKCFGFGKLWHKVIKTDVTFKM